MIPSILPHKASAVLLYGKVAQLQSNVGFDLACAVAFRTGGPVVFLVGGDDFARTLPRVRQWRLARGVSDDVRMRIFPIVAKNVVGSRHPARAVENESTAAPCLVVYDQSLSTSPINPHAAWWHNAHEIAQDLKCAVLSVGHVGHSNASPDVEADLSIRCCSYHSKALGHSLNVLLGFEGTDRPALRLNGRQAGSLVLFEPEDAEAEEAPKKPERTFVDQERWA